MTAFSKDDIRVILETLEDEVASLRNLSRVEKMKQISLIRRQGSWLSAFRFPTANKVYIKFQSKLRSLFYCYSPSFKDDFRLSLGKIIKKIEAEQHKNQENENS